MTQTCSNCLNAYNSPHDRDVHCVDREWMQQHQPQARTTVGRDETCGTWQRRIDTQKPLVFTQPAPDMPTKEVQILCFGTGQRMPEPGTPDGAIEHVGSVVTKDGFYVWHYYRKY